MTARTAAGACDHCLLPVSRHALNREIQGENRLFCCYGCCLAFQVRHGITEESEATWLLIRLGVGAFLAMNVMLLSLLIYSGAFEQADRHLLPWVHLLLWLLATPALLVLGGPYLRDSWLALVDGRLTAATLISLGAGAAYLFSALAVLRGSEAVYFDTATMLLLLFSVGRYLEAVGRARAVRNLAPLLEAETQWATRVEGGEERQCLAKDLPPGALVQARPGERLPVDGIVVEGRALVDESVITGESRSLEKRPGSAVIAGSILLDGPLLVRTTCTAGDTRWARIGRAVREALGRRSPIQRLVDRAAACLVPFVLGVAALAVLYWSRQGPLEEALLVGLAVLVVACPCGLGLATPMAASLALGRLARHGCLLRGGALLENLGRVRVVAFDKTGTLTVGRPRLVALESESGDGGLALARAAALERHSEHALARGILAAAAARKVTPPRAEAVTVLPGRGLLGLVEGQEVLLGTARWLEERGCMLPPRLARRTEALEETGQGLSFVAWGGRARAVFAFDDPLRPDAGATIAALRDLGFRPVLLSGDRPSVVRRVAAGLGIDDWQAELQPEEKRAALQSLAAYERPVAMVGDGVNDGPVLAAADVGIAVGSATDLARETADLVLPPEHLAVLPWAIRLARAARRTILTSLLWACGYNLVALALAAGGLLQPILAALLMAGSSVIVVLNSLRLERFPEPAETPQRVPDQPKQSAVKASYQLSA